MKKNKVFYNIFVWFSFILMLVYFAWRIWRTMPIEYGWVAIVAGIIFLVCEIVSALEAMIHIFASTNPIQPEKPVIPEDWYPEVDVFIATHNESNDILYKTINGCKYMKYPDKSKVHIWVCDDGYREEVKQLCEQMGVGWIGLANNKFAKAGNLNNAISKTNAPLIVTFDADMIPTRHFLLETVPFFFLPKMKKDENGVWVERTEEEIDKEYKIGFIQTPQSFYNYDLFQYNLYAEEGIPNEQDYFFREVNVARNKSNSPIYAGSNTVMSRQALKEAGGIATGTITEDFETGLHIQENGYSCYAISKVVAHGLSPDTIESLIKQRERWGRGCVYSLRRLHLWFNQNLSFKSKLSYFSCEIYWWTFLRRFVFILCPILFAVFKIPVMTCKPWELLVFWLPSYILFDQAQRIQSGNIRTTIWSNVIDTTMFPYLIIPIILEAIGIRKSKFHVTKKEREVTGGSDKTLAIPHIILLVFSIVALILSVQDLVNYQAYGSFIIIYWLCINGYALCMAIFFMLGRKNLRMSERYTVALPVKIIHDGITYYGETIDISEGGMAVEFKQPIYLPDESLRIHIKTHHYNAHMNVRQLYAQGELDKKTKEKRYVYRFKVDEFSEEDKSQYYQIIFDRDTIHPLYTSNTDSMFLNISSNINGRVEKKVQQKRRQYRIQLNKEFTDTTGKSVYVYDYSYEYILLSRKDSADREQINIPLPEGLVMQCEVANIIDNEKSLYAIKNGMELLFDEKFAQTLEEWVEIDGLF